MDIATSLRRVQGTARPPRVAVLLPTWRTNDWQHDCERIIEIASTVWGGDHWVIIPVDEEGASSQFLRLLQLYDPDYFVVYGKADVAPAFARFADQLLSNCAPFTGGSNFIAETISARTRSHRFPSIIKPETYVRYTRAAVEGLPDLWAGALLGRYSERTIGEIQDLDGGVVDGAEKTLTIQEALAESTLQDEFHAFGSADIPTPFQATRLSTWRVCDSMEWDAVQPTPIVVVGATLHDFCLYFTLSRIAGPTYWWPLGKDAKPTTKAALASAICEVTEGESTELHVISAASRIPYALHKASKTSTVRFRSIDSAQILSTDLPRRYLVAQSSSYPALLQFVDGQATSLLPDFRPSDRDGKAFSAAWVVDCEIEDYRPPQRQKLARWTFGAGRRWAVRAGPYGLSYSASTGAADSRAFVVRPSYRLRLLSPWAIAEQLDPTGNIKFSRSDKSSYAEYFIGMAGSLEEAGNLLNLPAMRRLAEPYMNQSTSKTSIVEYGFLSRGRRYCDIELLAKKVGDEGDATRLVDRLLGRSFLRRGHVLRCSLCRNTDWYDAEDIGQGFRCSRCREVQVIRQAQWNLKESKGLPSYYALHEMAFQCLHNGCDVTIKLAHLLKQQADSFLFVLEADVTGFSKNMQLDLLAIVDGVVVLGECKGGKPKNGEIKKSMATYSELASKIGAGRVVFARDGDGWRDEIKKAAIDLTPPIECIHIPEDTRGTPNERSKGMEP